jgi:hypothetical protein
MWVKKYNVTCVIKFFTAPMSVYSVKCKKISKVAKYVSLSIRHVQKAVLQSQSRKQPHYLVGAGARAVTQCGSISDGSDGSGSDNGIKSWLGIEK